MGSVLKTALGAGLQTAARTLSPRIATDKTHPLTALYTAALPLHALIVIEARE
ncbi:MAG: hypothetical protein ACPGGK_06385 [Pikeienuella sp.]